MSFTLEHGYLAAFLVGVGYSLCSGILTFLSGLHHGHHAGGIGPHGGHAHHPDHAGYSPDAHQGTGHDAASFNDAGLTHDAPPLHAHGHGPTAAHPAGGSGSSDQTLHFSPVSPVTLSMFTAVFGGTGLILSRVIGLPPLLSLPPATASGFAGAGAIFWVFHRIFEATQASSESRLFELVGQEGEVVTAIPAGGVGAIAYISKGTRYTGPARSEEGVTHGVNSAVIINRIAGGTFWVLTSSHQPFGTPSEPARGREGAGPALTEDSWWERRCSGMEPRFR